MTTLRIFILSLTAFLLTSSTPLFSQTVHSNTLNWLWSQGTGDAATGFHVFRSATTPVSTTTPYATVLSPATLTYVDTAVVAGQTWNYVITAFNSGGDSTPSNTATCVTPFSAPQAPTSLSAVSK